MQTELDIATRHEAIGRPDIRIEEATSEDVDAVHDLLLAESAKHTVLPRTKEDLATIIASPYDKLFVYRDKGVARGSVILEYYDPRWLAELRSLAVDPQYRGKKIGEALTGKAVAHLLASGVDQAYTTTNIPNFFEQKAYGFSKRHKGKKVVWRHEGVGELLYAPFFKHMPAIRPATDNDRQAIFTLCMQARSSKELTVRDIERIDHFYPTFWVHEQDGEVTGCVSCHTFGDRMAELSELTVRPDMQQQGIGSALLYAGRQVTRTSHRTFAVTDDLPFVARLGFHPEETGKSIRWLNP